jgi:hypothetical protein
MRRSSLLAPIWFLVRKITVLAKGGEVSAEFPLIVFVNMFKRSACETLKINGLRNFFVWLNLRVVIILSKPTSAHN